MLVTELNTFLTSFIKRIERPSSLLVDGLWGCGKTFTIQKYLNDEYDSSHIYISLFGLDSVDSIVAQLSSRLDSSFIVNVGGRLSLVQPTIPTDFNDCIIVFDDLERKGPNLEFVSVYGVVDSLKTLGFNVICVCNSAQINGDADYDEFKEKAIDDIVKVEADSRLFVPIIGDEFKEIDFEDSLLKSVNGNWRTIKRGADTFKTTVMEAYKRGHKNILLEMNYNPDDFFKACCYSSACNFVNNTDKPSLDNNSLLRIEYEENAEEFNDSIANHFYYLFHGKGNANYFLLDMVKALIKLFNDKNYDNFFNLFLKDKIPDVSEESLLAKEPFYLDDEGHKNYKKEFFANLDKFDFHEKQQEQLLRKVLSNYLPTLNKKEWDALIKRIVDTVPLRESDYFVSMLLPLEEYKNEARRFKNDLLVAFEKAKKKNNQDTIDRMFEKREYNKLTDFIYNNRYVLKEQKDAIIDYLAKNDFYLPDLSKEITYDSWGYCHEVAKFVNGTEYQETFIEALKKQQNKHPKSNVLKERCNALVKYNFGMEQDYFK